MTVHYDILEDLGLQRGAMALGGGQFRKRIEAFQRREWHPLLRDKDPEGYRAWVASMAPTLAEAEEAFVFNHQLAAYRAAVARLARYRLADGRPEVIEDQPTGEFDPETGEPEYTGTQMIPNPDIVKDDVERAKAESIVDGTPQEVKNF